MPRFPSTSPLMLDRKTMAMPMFVQKGGLRWGASHWSGVNATWPFATLRASPDRLSISVRASVFLQGDVVLSKSDIIRIRKKHGIPLLNVGIIIEHRARNSAPYILFWTMSYSRLRFGLSEIGYEIDDG